MDEPEIFATHCKDTGSGSHACDSKEREGLRLSGLNLFLHLKTFKDLDVCEAGVGEDVVHLVTFEAMTLHACMLSM